MLITNAQFKVLCRIEDFIQDNGYAPTLREIARLVGVASFAGIKFHLKALDKAGVIKLIPKISRGIVILTPSEEMLV